MNKINTILFDLDGTLVDSNNLLIDSFKETFLKFFPQISFTTLDHINMIGPSLEDTFSCYTNNSYTIKDMISFFRSYYVIHEFNSITLYPNVIEVLKWLKDHQFNIGIITTKFKESAMPSIRYFQLDAFIDVFVFLDDVSNPKPDPEPIILAKGILKNCDQILMIGDNPSDILSGKNAGTLTCGVSWSYKSDALRNTHPDFWIDSFIELIDIINQYNKEEIK